MAFVMRKRPARPRGPRREVVSTDGAGAGALADVLDFFTSKGIDPRNVHFNTSYDGEDCAECALTSVYFFYQTGESEEEYAARYGKYLLELEEYNAWLKETKEERTAIRKEAAARKATKDAKERVVALRAQLAELEGKLKEQGVMEVENLLAVEHFFAAVGLAGFLEGRRGTTTTAEDSTTPLINCMFCSKETLRAESLTHPDDHILRMVGWEGDDKRLMCADCFSARWSVCESCGCAVEPCIGDTWLTVRCRDCMREDQ